MATLTEESAFDFFLIVPSGFGISNFSYKHKRHFFEIFEYGDMHLKIDHLMLSASLETLLKCHM